MKRNLRSSKKGMSIVISTIIIVAISITMAIAVSFWAMGIGNSFTKFEKLEFISVYADNTVNLGAVGAGSGAIATANVDVNGRVASIDVTNGGTGYTSGATVSIASPGGSGQVATATASVSNGVIIRITVIAPGSGYTSSPVVTISPRMAYSANFPIYLQIKNTGSAAATINNVFLDGKPYDAPTVNAPTPRNLIGIALPVGFKLGAPNGAGGRSIIYLPSGATWNSGDYVEVEIETVAGRIYSTTVVLP